MYLIINTESYSCLLFDRRESPARTLHESSDRYLFVQLTKSTRIPLPSARRHHCPIRRQSFINFQNFALFVVMHNIHIHQQWPQRSCRCPCKPAANALTASYKEDMAYVLPKRMSFTLCTKEIKKGFVVQLQYQEILRR